MSDDLIEQSAARLFADTADKALRQRVEAGEFPQALWQLAMDNGFGLVLTTEDAGGLGQPWSAAYPVLRGLGYWQVPLPLAETLIAGQLLSMAGIAVPEGPIALIEQGHDAELQLGGEGAAARLGGQARRVAWARHCGHALASLADGRIALLAMRQGEAVRCEPGLNHARLPADQIVFRDAALAAIADNPMPGLAAPVWTLGATARAIMMVGALEWLLEQSVQYANDRVQFGKPIGRNQAIQQQLAMLAGDVAAARVAARVAAADAPWAGSPQADHARFSAAVAKVRVGEAASRGAAIAHQVHGAIGFTHEHSLHFATRRLWAWREEFGADAWWAERLGQAAIAAGAAGFWPALTQRALSA